MLFCSLAESNVSSNRRTLVHCVAGKSRSVSVVAAFLMKSQRVGLQQAYETIKNRHSFLWPGPNAGFISQLSRFEVDLFPACASCESSAAAAR